LPAYAVLAHHAGWSTFATVGIHLALTLAWFGAAERWWPHRVDWAPDGAALRRDGIFFGANALTDTVGSWLVRGSVVMLAGRPDAGGPAHDLPLWIAVPLAVCLAELGAYGLHRLSHAGGWLWRVHAVHHRPESLNAANNFTAHPFNVLLLKIVKLVPLLLLGFDEQAVLLATLFLQLQSFATHANTRGGMGWLNYVVGTAELHRRHHSIHAQEALNFATAVPLWDQVFGSFRYRATLEPVRVGLETPEHYPASTDWLGLLKLPLEKRPISQPSPE
jgi:sterol desaturase/sphingolipid hydroxylase (fatty acid hydroxylase superfamily)